MKVLEAPLAAISLVARPYPAYLLPEGGTGLCLFAAAFLGHNDAIHMARMEMEISLVDLDPKVQQMGDTYWPYVKMAHVGDAWEFAEWAYDEGMEWDVVSADTFTGEAERKSLDSLGLWCSLARNAVTVTHSNGSDYTVPKGWTGELFARSSDVNWLVLTRNPAA